MNIYYTIEAAEAILPKVRPLLESARRLKQEIELIAAGYDYDTVLLEQEKPRINSLGAKLTRKLEALEELGCYVKDLDIGLVDFLANFEDRDVFLCWKLGEPRISHWHELNEGFSRRQEIMDMTQLDLEFDFEMPLVEQE
ncbi:MAG: DUF2203 domain-containing protein [Candidatus Woesearchaeota archaeon]|nr:DUF2203 domain-containing protein [Candidatus Woesearchaeota archaeon]